MKPKEIINQMQTQFTHIMRHMRTLVKTFSNEELVIEIHIFLNHSWKLKVSGIYESKNLATMDTHDLFGKLQEHEMEMKRLADDEEITKRIAKMLRLKLPTMKIWNQKMKNVKVRLINLRGSCFKNSKSS